jgi:nucleotide-binding universal stress UspA family protein
MFKKIVWATDGSESAEKALPVARSLAKEDGASLVVVHAVETYTGSRAAGLPVYVDETELQEKIKGQIAELESSGIQVESRFVTDLGVRPAPAIAEAARETGADLIVLGTRGHTPLSGLLLGSVTQRLLHIAPCPVLAVPAESTSARGDTEAAQTAAA